MLKIFRKIQTKDDTINRIQDSLVSVLNPVAKISFLDGAQLTNLAITTSAQKFSHNLNRQPQGWFLVDLQGSAIVFRVSWTATTVSLQASSDVTCSLWIW